MQWVWREFQGTELHHISLFFSSKTRQVSIKRENITPSCSIPAITDATQQPAKQPKCEVENSMWVSSLVKNIKCDLEGLKCYFLSMRREYHHFLFMWFSWLGTSQKSRKTLIVLNCLLILCWFTAGIDY